MGNKWIGRLITLAFLGIPAILFLLSSVYGTVPAAFEHWFSAKDRAEQKELYSIIGDQEVSKVATKYISGSMVCIDSFNDSELPMEFEQVWVTAQDNVDETPLRGAVFLFTGGNTFNDNGFSKEAVPSNCLIENEELNVSLATQQKITAICEREAKVSTIVSRSLNSHFTIRSEDGDYLNGAYVETQYYVDCDLQITEVRDCLPRNYGDKLGASLTHEYDFGAFTEYNYCDNPENSEFKRQVFDKWERSRKLKESDDE